MISHLPFFRRRSVPSRRGRRRSPRRPGGFTLVELLAVMGIITLLLVATVPALRGPLGSNARRGAVTNLLGALDQARALAISEGRATYVVFAAVSPADYAGRAKGKLAGDLYGRGYAIFAEKDNASFALEMRSPWQYLPTGVAFKVDAAANKEALSVTNQPPDALAFPVPPARGASGGNVELPYWKFDATGAASLSANTLPEDAHACRRLLLFEGSLNPATGAEMPTRRAAGGSDDPSKQRFVWEEIRLNYATGRVRYTVDPADIAVAAVPTP